MGYGARAWVSVLKKGVGSRGDAPVLALKWEVREKDFQSFVVGENFMGV